MLTRCAYSGCERTPVLYRKHCAGHERQKSRGEQLAPVRPYPPTGHRPQVKPERVELYRRIAEESITGRSLFAQAKALGVTHGQLKHLRIKADVYGFEVHPVSPENRRGVKYETAARMEEQARNVPRCRCGLALPCNNCLPTIADLASSRRGDSGGLTT